MTKKEFYQELEEYSNNDYVLINDSSSVDEKVVKVKKVNDDFFDWSDTWDDDDVGDISITKVVEIEDYLYEDEDFNIYKTDFVPVRAGIDFEKVIEKE